MTIKTLSGPAPLPDEIFWIRPCVMFGLYVSVSLIPLVDRAGSINDRLSLILNNIQRRDDNDCNEDPFYSFQENWTKNDLEKLQAELQSKDTEIYILKQQLLKAKEKYVELYTLLLKFTSTHGFFCIQLHCKYGLHCLLFICLNDGQTNILLNKSLARINLNLFLIEQMA